MKKCLTAGMIVATILVALPQSAQSREIRAGALWGYYGAEWDDDDAAGDSSVGVTFGGSRDITYYGGKFSHRINDHLRASIDLGVVELDTPLLDDGIAVQGGLSHKLNLDLPAGIGTEVQVKGFYTFIDDVDIYGGSVGAYGTYDFDLSAKVDLKAYAGLSLNYQDINYSATFLRDSSDVDLGETLGLRLDFNKTWAVESSYTYIEEPIFLVGTRILF